VALLVLAVGVWWLHGRQAVPDTSRSAAIWRVIPLILALAAGVGAVVQVYRIGDSGAEAVWEDRTRGTEDED
jgi:hypothetical protein